MKKVVLGLSGGVDSAVSALLLRNDGYEVSAVYLDAGLPGGAEAARSNAAAIGIPLEVADIRQELERLVCAPFVRGYLRGETPNPCVICNPEVKFAALIRYADSIGAEFISTGHYARILREGGRARLFKGESGNDQSYMLCMIKKGQLERLLLPLGGFDKAGVRGIARKACLPSADAPDSMEICFVPDGNYAAFIERRRETPRPGNFINEAGIVLGRHMGIHHYTVGQRRGLKISSGGRLYVSEIRPDTNEIVLSGAESLMTGEITACRVNWLTVPPEGEFEAYVRIRHSKEEYPALITACGSEMSIKFKRPVRASAPGQAAAVYMGDELAAGGIIGL